MKKTNFPKNWATAKLKEVIKYKKGKKPKLLLDEPEENYLPYLLIDELEGKPIRKFAKGDGCPVANESDVLVVWDGSIGKTATGLRGVVGSTIAVLSPIMIESKFLQSFIDFKQSYIQMTSRGSGLQHINQDTFWKMDIPIPPLSEQKRIVAKIFILEKQLKQIATGLNQIEIFIKNFRRNILLHATFGNLTESWRKNNKINKKFEISILDTICEIPKSWKILPLEDVSAIRSGVTLGRKISGKKISVPYLRVANVQDGYLDLQVIKNVEVLPDEIEKWKLQKGDVVLTEGGDWDKLGRGTVWNDEIPNCIHQNHIFRVRTSKILNPNFLIIQISSLYGKKYFQQASKQSVNLASINSTQLKAFSVFIPPIEEQNEIVKITTDLMNYLEEIKKNYDKVVEMIETLPRSILLLAFSGNLVSQNSSEGTGFQLLEKISKEFQN